MRWFGHVHRKLATATVRKSLSMQVAGSPRKMGKLKRTWKKVVRLVLKKCNYPRIWPKIDQSGETKFI